MKLTTITIQIIVILTVLLTSCNYTKWRYSIEQVPAEPVAYLKDGVFVSGDYIRNASIIEIDGVAIEHSNDKPLQVSIGKHSLKILCAEASGEYDSANLSGKEKLLEFEAETQRTYLIRCIPFTHWWVEDSENKKIVAGNKPDGD